jgi:hypothetical protein
MSGWTQSKCGSDRSNPSHEPEGGPVLAIAKNWSAPCLTCLTLDAAERAQRPADESVLRRAPADRIVGRTNALQYLPMNELGGYSPIAGAGPAILQFATIIQQSQHHGSETLLSGATRPHQKRASFLKNSDVAETDSQSGLLENAITRLGLSARAYDPILKVS